MIDDLFQPDSKPMQVALLLFRLMLLNLLTIVFSIPIVTMGTAFTAMYAVNLKLVREEDPFVLRTFWNAFTGGLGKTLPVWLGTIVIGGLLIWDVYFVRTGSVEFNAVGIGLLCLIAALFLLWNQWFFVLQSRYENTIRQTAKNATFVSVRYFSRSLGMLILGLVPIVIIWNASWFVIVVLFFGFSGCGYFQAQIYSKIFYELEKTTNVEETAEEAF